MKYVNLLSATAIAALAAAPLCAQTASAEAEQIEEIVVYGQKNARAESVQKVPIAITAISGSTLTAANATSIVDVGRIAPNAELQPAPRSGFSNFFIRGIGLNGTVRSIDPAVNLIVDGMVIAFPVATILDTFDVESVEVLRGPQGILFGRNTTGGAVSFRTRRPTGKFGFEGDVTVGNFGRFDASGMIEGSLVEDKLFAKIAVLHRESNGFFKDKNTGIFVPTINNPTGTDTSTKKDEVARDDWAIRPTIVWKPTPELDITLLGEYTSLKGGGIAHRTPLPNAILQNQFGYTPQLGKFQINNNFPGYHDGTSYRGVAEINWDVGPGVLASVTGYRKVRYKEAFDTDGTPFVLFEIPEGNGDRSRQFSQELRFASNFSDTFRFVVGGFYNNLTMDVVERRLISTLTAAPVRPNTLIRQQGIFSQDAEAAAGFFNAEWTVMPGLRVSGGGRYSWEQKKVDIVPISLCPGTDFSTCPTVTTKRKKSWKDFSPRLGVDYEIAEDVLAYLTWSNGFRSGNFNARAQNVAQIGPVDPESAEAFELGLKSTFWDRRARVNLSVFQTNYDDIQRTVLSIGNIQTLQNAAKARIRGFEAEVTLKPIEGLQLDGSLGYLDAKYRQFLGLDLTGDGVPDPARAKNLKFDRVPKWTYYLAASYEYPLSDDSSLSTRVSYSARSSYFVDVANNPVLAEDGYGLLDASVAFRTGQWRVAVFGKNLTNKYYVDFGSVLPAGPNFFLGDPRTYGLTVSFKY